MILLFQKKNVLQKNIDEILKNSIKKLTYYGYQEKPSHQIMKVGKGKSFYYLNHKNSVMKQMSFD